jgi:NAD(P)H-hydrate repair Nnr-like enzyme with NAD(P)H-hydrate dehydratase domain
LWARTHNLEKATLLGVYLHGLAGDLVVQKIHEESVVASDLINEISNAFGNL